MESPIVAISGAINWDINLFVSRFGRPGEEVPVPKIERVPGGKGANVAVAAARILGKGKCAMVGGIGNDEIGDKHLQIFSEEGVDNRYLIRFNEVESGQAYILIDEKGENQINTYFGANIALKAVDAENIRDLLAEIKFLVVMDPPVGFTGALLSLSKNVIKLWSPGVRVYSDKEFVISRLCDVNYLVLNEHEMVDISGLTDIPKVYEELKENNPDLNVIVTQGSKGVSLYMPRDKCFVEGIDLGRLGLKVVNTTGCGDAFIGAFVANLALGLSEKSALEMANLAGAIKASKFETRGSPTRKELKYYHRQLSITC